MIDPTLINKNNYGKHNFTLQLQSDVKLTEYATSI